MTGSLAADLDLAKRAGLVAARVSLDYFARVASISPEIKSDGTLVTEADRAVEEAVRTLLLAERPTDACLGEEIGAVGRGHRRWILDGIDGTAAFVRGETRWQTLIGLEQDGRMVVGLAVTAAQGRIWWAARGLGAWAANLNNGMVSGERTLSVATAVTDLASCRFALVGPTDRMMPRHSPAIERLVALNPPRRWPTHAGLLLAAGEIDLVIQVGAAGVWDFAAVSLIVEEAGGRFSGLDGRPHPVDHDAIYAATPELHAAALEHLRRWSAPASGTIPP